MKFRYEGVARWFCGRTLGFGPTGSRWPSGSIPGRPVTKSRSTADHRVAAVGKLFTLIALTGVVAVHDGYGSRSIWRRLVNSECAAVHVRHILIRVELCRCIVSIVKLVRLSLVEIKNNIIIIISSIVFCSSMTMLRQ